MKKIALLSVLGVSIFVTTCYHDEGFNIALPNIDTVLTDVAYGDHPLQRMDVYLPANRSVTTKIIVFVHGGSWIAGDKTDGKATAIYFQKKGYAAISINYRLAGTSENNIHPSQVEDIGKALNFITQKYVQWIITGNRICLIGTSAGAHLSLLYAYKYDSLKKVKAVVSISGLIDLTDPKITNSNIKYAMQLFMGCAKSENETAWLEASPSHYISETSVPTRFFQGTKDIFVPYRETIAAYNKLQELGVNTELTLFQNEGHGLEGVKWEEDILDKAEQFAGSAYY